MADAPLVWLTGLLAVATAYLAWETRSMARATKAMAELSATPYLAFLAIDLQPTVDSRTGRQGYVVPIRLTNPGQVRIHYRVGYIALTLADVEYPAANFDNRGGYLHPKEETTFSYPFFECATPLTGGLTGFLTFEARFWAVESEQHRFKFKLRFWVAAVSDAERRIAWSFVSGPDYTLP